MSCCGKVFCPCFPCRNKRRVVSDHKELQPLGSIRGTTSELHTAAVRGNVSRLKELITQNQNPRRLLEKDDVKHRTPLHYAASFWDDSKSMSMVTEILDANKDLTQSLLDAKDRQDETPLHLSIRFRNPKVAQLLLDLGSDYMSKTKYGKTALDLMYEYMPSLACSVFDNCINFKTKMKKSQSGIPKLDKSQFCLNLKPILGPNNAWDLPDTQSIIRVLHNPKKKYKDLLLHPLVQLFIQVKWESISSVFRFSIIFHIFWSLLCAAYLFSMYVVWCPYRAYNSQNGTTNSSSTECDSCVQCDVSGSFLRPWKWALIVMSTVMGFKEFCEMATSGKKRQYFSKLENVGQLLLIVLIIFATAPILFFSPSYPEIQLKPWHYRIAAVAMLLPWILILGQIGKSHRFGVYVEIFIRVCKRLLLFTLAFISILVAFASSFVILMPDYELFQDVSSSFSKFFVMLTKTFVMMTGEFEFEEMFSDKQNGGRMGFPIMASVIFVSFVAIVPIALYNLLMALNVTDIQTLQEDAEISELASSLERIHLMEEFLITCNKFPRLYDLKNKFSIKNWDPAIISVKAIKTNMTLLDDIKRDSLIEDLKRLAYRNKSASL